MCARSVISIALFKGKSSLLDKNKQNGRMEKLNRSNYTDIRELSLTPLRPAVARLRGAGH